MSEDWMKKIKENWFIILFIGGLVVSWTNINNRVSVIELSDAKQDIRLNSAETSVSSINANLAAFRAEVITSLNFIKDKLSR